MNRLRFLAVIIWGVCLAAAFSSRMAHGQIDIDRAKIVYVQNFIGLVHWEKKDGNGEVVFCSFLDSRLGRQMLEMLNDRPVASFTIATRGLNLDNPAVAGCDVLFIPESLADYAPALLARSGNSRVLTISDMEGFVRRGGMIGLVMEGDKLRFDIGMQAASRQHIGFSAKLLELARQVRR